jgi:outer membrane protein assembly factor BamB
MKEWPKEGPRLVWKVADVGSGYAAPSTLGDRLFLLGNEGMEDEFVQALSLTDGGRLWRTRLGKVGNPDQQPPFPAARSTPTIDGDVLYALGSDGDLACVELANGKVRWHKNLRKDFGGKPGTWAYSESPLVDGSTLVCTPGGSEAAIVALDKKTGELLWKTALPEPEEAAYSSIIIVETSGARHYVQMLQKGLTGVDAKSGKVLWRYPRTVSRFRANIPTAVARENLVFSAGAGSGAGLVRLAPKGDSMQAEEVYFSPKLPTAIGGAVLAGDYLYGTANQGMVCIDFATGEQKWDNPGIGPASICYADARLYLHGENGDVALVEPQPDAYVEKGRFTPQEQPKRRHQMEKAWAYPVVSNGRLYIRDHQMLWCYDVKARM